MWGNWGDEESGMVRGLRARLQLRGAVLLGIRREHVELTDAYDKPVIDWLPLAQSLATARGFTGAFYRVHIGPPPNGSADPNEWNMKAIGAFAATGTCSQHYYMTAIRRTRRRSTKPSAQSRVFWRDYLIKDGTRYVIENDAQQEGDQYRRRTA